MLKLRVSKARVHPQRRGIQHIKNRSPTEDSAVATIVSSPTLLSSEWRLINSAHSEKKIDGIARDLSDIKQLLQKPPETSSSSLMSLKPGENRLFLNIFSDSFGVQRQFTVNTSYKQRDGSKLASHMVDFINCVADFPDPTNLGADSWTLISSLRASSEFLKHEMPLQVAADSMPRRTDGDADMSMPPQEAAVSILRWARSMYFVTPNSTKPHLIISQTLKSTMKLRGSSKFFPLRESRTSAKRCTLRSMTMRIWTSSLPAVASVISSSRMHRSQAQRSALSMQACARITSGKSQHACLSSYQQLATR
jgi:hypothetical protein